MDSKIQFEQNKGSLIYREQISQNVGEKCGDLMRFILNRELPKKHGYIRILDIGVGGGETIKMIKKEVKDPKMKIVGMDLLKTFAENVNNPEKGVFGNHGDIMHMKFHDETFSAINLSAVLHEVISYSPNILNHSTTPSQVFESVINYLILKLIPGGVITYRDVGLPENYREVVKKHFDKSVKMFVLRFTESFYNKFYIVHGWKNLEINYESDNMEVYASVHLHREIQRHLITYLDFAIRRKFGINLKQSIVENKYNSNIFLDMVTRACESEEMYDEWSKREGLESYTYLPISSIIDVVKKSKNSTMIEIVDIKTTHRNEYDMALALVCSEFIPDTKQMVTFKRKQVN